MSAFHFELVSPDRQVFSGQAEAVLVPGGEGDFVVLKDHAPVMASIRPGIVDIGEAGDKHTRLFVRGGFAACGNLHPRR
jgi:F-type H+-transporting ATPase subunit epsilon